MPKISLKSNAMPRAGDRHLRALLLLQQILFVALFLAHPSAGRNSQSLHVRLSHGGWLIGRHLTTHNGRHMRAFMGIPYAEPPVGDLRFRPPVPVAGWSGERPAIKDAPICLQRDPFRRDMIIEGSEDCLYLNVYTPERPLVNGSLPVMVWFHGGGWQCGSGISSFYGPDFLLDHDIVLVSANFRLGPLGFLSTETLDCPGNNGLKDQLEVLRWVRANIASFGGDPGSVTVFGESAGGASVTYHMLSEKSRGLLHRGIAQSGTYFNPWAQPAHRGVAASRAAKLADIVGCGAGSEAANWAERLECLRKKPAEDVVASLYDMFVWDFDPMIPFPPVIEPEHDDAFLTVVPRKSPQPHGLELPLMVGATAEEGLLKTAALLNLPHLMAEFKNQFDQVLPVVLNYDHHEDSVRDGITQRIESFYFKAGHDYSKANHQNLTDLISDGWFVAGIDEYLRLRMSGEDVAPTYVYLFDHKGAASFSEIFKGERNEFYGACHAEELQYLFPIGRELFVSAVPTPQDLELRDLMLQLWVSFARTGNPNPANVTTGLPTWNPASSYPVEYARLGTKADDQGAATKASLFRLENELMQQRVDFWRDLQPHLPASQPAHSEL